MSSSRLKKNQIKSKGKISSKPKFKYTKRENIKTKKLQEEKDTLEKQMSDLNLNLETNIHRQQNKETQQTEQVDNPQT